MNRTAKKPPTPARRQKTIQMFDFATALKRKVTTDLREIPTVVVSAAMLAFSKLPVEQQLDHIRETRKQHTVGA